MVNQMSDNTSVEENAARDAAAVTAALFKGDVESAGVLLACYEGDPVAQSKLCGSLAAVSAAILQTVDRIGEEMMTVHGVPFPSSRQVLAGVLLKLAEPLPTGETSV
jgi:hypothetical protein